MKTITDRMAEMGLRVWNDVRPGEVVTLPKVEIERMRAALAAPRLMEAMDLMLAGPRPATYAAHPLTLMANAIAEADRVGAEELAQLVEIEEDEA